MLNIATKRRQPDRIAAPESPTPLRKVRLEIAMFILQIGTDLAQILSFRSVSRDP